MELANVQKRQLSYWDIRLQDACPLCEGTGFQFVTEQGRMLARKCRCLSRSRVERLIKNSRIPVTFRDESLENIRPESLREAYFVDTFKDFLNAGELKGLHFWILPEKGIKVRRILCGFANDLIQRGGYLCYWLDFNGFTDNSIPSKSASGNLETNLREATFLFVENYRLGCLGIRQQKSWEEIIWTRVVDEKSTLFLVPRLGPTEIRAAFSDGDLGQSIPKKFEVIQPTSTGGCFHHSLWLF